MNQLQFDTRAQQADALLEIRASIIRGDSRVRSAVVDETSKLRMVIELPGSETVDRRGKR